MGVRTTHAAKAPMLRHFWWVWKFFQWLIKLIAYFLSIASRDQSASTLLESTSVKLSNDLLGSHLWLNMQYYQNLIVGYYTNLPDRPLWFNILLYQLVICGLIRCSIRFLLWPAMRPYQVLIGASYLALSYPHSGLICCSTWSLFIAKYIALSGSHLWPNMSFN